jgi:phospholipid/cholesterol/gamma-HCH transport system substrate-binding protein
MERRFGTEAKVGIFVLIGLIILAWGSLRIGKFDLVGESGYAVWAVFPSAAGLKRGVAVEMAGIPIGAVRQIDLYRGQAKIVLSIKRGISIPVDSVVSIQTRGVLGDKYVEISRGMALPQVNTGGRIVRTHTPADLSRVLAKVGDIASDMKDISQALKQSIASPESTRNIQKSLKNLAELTAKLNQTLARNQAKVDRIIANISDFSRDMKAFSGDMKAIIANNRENIDRIIKSVSQSSRVLVGTMYALRKISMRLASGQGTLGQLIQSDTTIRRLNSTLAELRSVVAKINSGRGTLGKLVNDDTTVNRLNDALASVNNYLTRTDAWKFTVSYRNEYMTRYGDSRSALNLVIQPKADKYYILGLVYSPRGRTNTIETSYEYGGSRIGQDYTEKRVIRDRNELLLNAQIGKRFYDLRVRAGIFESTGGVGLDYYLWNDRIQLTAEAFDFDPDRQPRVRAYADIRIWKYLTVTVGMDDIVSNQGGASFFVGAGIRFDDDDLKYLISSVPIPKQ